MLPRPDWLLFNICISLAMKTSEHHRALLKLAPTVWTDMSWDHSGSLLMFVLGDCGVQQSTGFKELKHSQNLSECGCTSTCLEWLHEI